MQPDTFVLYEKREDLSMKVGFILMVTIGVLMSLWVGWGTYVIYGIERPRTRLSNAWTKRLKCVNTDSRRGFLR